MEALLEPRIWTALVTLIAIEIVLGIDNIVFISILVSKLRPSQQQRARIIGLAVAMLTRILLLFTLSWFIGLTSPLFEVLGREFSLRDLILIGGGLFLLAKATLEMHDKLEGNEHDATTGKAAASFASVIIQIALLDIVFSIDSVVTAIGLADDLWVMVVAIVVAVGVMLVSARAVSNFIDDHPTLKILALSFLLLIGLTLMGEGFELHIPKGYVYFAMAFSVFVEVINLRIRSQKQKPVQLRPPGYAPKKAAPEPPITD